MSTLFLLKETTGHVFPLSCVREMPTLSPDQHHKQREKRGGRTMYKSSKNWDHDKERDLCGVGLDYYYIKIGMQQPTHVRTTESCLQRGLHHIL